MPNNEPTSKDIYNTLYRKLKQATYYEPDLKTQVQLSNYENAYPTTNPEVIDVIDNILEGKIEAANEIISKWLEQITYTIQPKRVEMDETSANSNQINTSSKDTIFTNITTAKNYWWSDANYLFDIPIPLLLLDIWWVQEVGTILDKELGDCCYANRIHPQVFRGAEDKGSHLFKKYFDQYNLWRKNAIQTASEALNRKENVLIITMDFSKYFYSIDINIFDVVNKIEENISLNKIDKLINLTKIVYDMQIKCTEMIADDMKLTHSSIDLTTSSDNTGNKNGKQTKILPLGLFSSKVLSNWYLRDFDKCVFEKLRPLSYGRYVDDTIFVIGQSTRGIANNMIPEKFTEKDVNRIMEEYFIRNELLKIHETEPKDITDTIDSRDTKDTTESKDTKEPKDTTDITYYAVGEGISENRILINESKVKIFQLEANHSKALIEKLNKIIADNTNVFKYLPEVPLEETSGEIYSIIYKDKETNKLRDIERLSVNPSALSILIAKQSANLRICGQPDKIDETFINSLVSDLKGINYLEYIRSWEKLFTLLVLTNAPRKAKEVYSSILKSIKTLKFDKTKIENELETTGNESDKPRYLGDKVDTLSNHVIQDLTEQLNNSLAIAIALLSPDNRENFINVKRTESTLKQTTSENIVENDSEESNKLTIQKSANAIRKANMFRQHHISYPLINYIKDYNGDLCGINVFSKEFLSDKEITFELDDDKMKLSPRFIHSYEYQLYYALKRLKTGEPLTTIKERQTDKQSNKKGKDNQTYSNAMEDKCIDGYLSTATDAYYECHIWLKDYGDEISEYPITELTSYDKETVGATKIIVKDKKIDEDTNSIKQTQSTSKQTQNTTKQNKKLRICIANLYLDEKTIFNNCLALNSQDTSIKRWLDISKLLNIATSENCDLLVFPECAIPAQWIYPLTIWSREHQIGVVFGVEHIFSIKQKTNDDKNTSEKNTIEKKIYANNLTVALLPYYVSDLYKTCCVSLRLKNHYAPSEKALLMENNSYIPEQNTAIYHLYNWRGSQFSVYNCFELADIFHRGMFRSHLDYFIACSYNKDVTYFKDIIDSLTRDLHCYVIHSNTAKYGCSRILEPVKHEERTIAQIGGGKNPVALVGEIDITKLACFQTKVDAKDSKFKPLPPGFNSEMVIKRHKSGDEKKEYNPQRVLSDF